MTVAHVAGLPVEELALSIAGAGSGLLLARAWLAARLRRRDARAQDQGGSDERA